MMISLEVDAMWVMDATLCQEEANTAALGINASNKLDAMGYDGDKALRNLEVLIMNLVSCCDELLSIHLNYGDEAHARKHSASLECAMDLLDSITANPPMRTPPPADYSDEVTSEHMDALKEMVSKDPSKTDG